MSFLFLFCLRLLLLLLRILPLVLVVVLVLFHAVLALVHFFSDALPLQQPGVGGCLSQHFPPLSRLFFERAPS